VGAKVAIIHYNVKICNTSWNWTGWICDIWFLALNVEVDSIRANAHGVVDGARAGMKGLRRNFWYTWIRVHAVDGKLRGDCEEHTVSKLVAKDGV
jgi:hypothetical protein